MDDAADRIRASFAKQGLMSTLGAAITAISPGRVEVSLKRGPANTQQHGFVHGGTISAIADTAAGYAALSLMPADRGVLTAEFKINFVAPAAGDRIIARGTVVKPGRTLSLVQAEVFSHSEGRENLVALLTATMVSVEGRPGVRD